VALALNTPTAPGPIGPGYVWSVSTSLVGPFPNDDFVDFRLLDALSFAFVIGATAYVHGTNTAYGLIGVREVPGSTFIIGKLATTLTGGNVTLSIIWRHANGTVVESLTLTNVAWLFDPVGGLADCVFQSLRTGGMDLSAIYNAVIKTKSLPGQEP